MTKTVTQLLEQFGNLPVSQQREFFDAIQDHFDGRLAFESEKEFRASGSEGIPVKEAFARVRKGSCATQ